MPYLITEDGSMTDVTPKGKEFTLEEMQAFVGGLVQLVPSIRCTAKPHPILTVKHETARTAWCNEEGLLKGLSENRLASLLAGQPLVGPVVLFTSRDPKDEWNLDGGIDGETEIGEKYGEEILGVTMPDLTDCEDKLISELISELKDMDESLHPVLPEIRQKEARDMQEQIAYWKAFRLAYAKLKWSQRDLVQSIVNEEDN